MAFGKRFAEQARYLVADLGDSGRESCAYRSSLGVPRLPQCHRLPVLSRDILFPTQAQGIASRPRDRGLRDFYRRRLRGAARRSRRSASQGAPPRIIPGIPLLENIPHQGGRPYLFPEVEDVARELGFYDDRDRITCQEMLFNVTAQEGREQRFFEVWDALAAHPALDAYHKRHPVHGGTIEGVSMGIASCASGLTIQGSNEMDSIFLPKVFWHCALDYRKRRYHKARNWIFSRSGFLESADLSRSALG